MGRVCECTHTLEGTLGGRRDGRWLLCVRLARAATLLPTSVSSLKFSKIKSLKEKKMVRVVKKCNNGLCLILSSIIGGDFYFFHVYLYICFSFFYEKTSLYL